MFTNGTGSGKASLDQPDLEKEDDQRGGKLEKGRIEGRKRKIEGEENYRKIKSRLENIRESFERNRDAKEGENEEKKSLLLSVNTAVGRELWCQKSETLGVGGGSSKTGSEPH